MGHQVIATCLECRTVFKLLQGGGFAFHLVRCDRCGKTKSVGVDQLPDSYLCYPKNWPTPHGVAGTERDGYARELSDGGLISERERQVGVERVAGACSCGGSYRCGAPARCPNCRSTRIEEGRITLWYD